MEIRLRRARKEDIDDFVKVYRSAYKGMKKYWYKRDKIIRWYFRWLLKRDPEGVFVAELGGKIVGFIACDSNWENLFEEKLGEIHELVVMNEYKGKGIGSFLLKRGEEYLKAKGCSVIELWVGKKNPARKFYEKFGYEEEGENEDWIRMVKRC